MTTEWLYFAVTFVMTVAVGGATAMVAWSDRRADDAELADPSRWLPLAVGVVLLVAVAVILRVRAFAEADGRIVEQLADARSAGLDDVFSLVTRIGDMVPTYTIAASLAIGLMVSTRRVLSPMLLILLVPVELGLQFFLADHVFQGLTIDDVEPLVPLGGAGSNPSGATARLLSVFLVAAALCRPAHRFAAKVFVVTGAIVTLIEVISRLYLGRHLLTDIIGGLLLGVCLAIVAGAVANALAPVERRLASRVPW